MKFRFAPKVVDNLLRKHTPEYLMANILVVEERSEKKEISNVEGYLMRAFQDDYSSEQTEFDKIKKQEELKKETVEKNKEVEKQQLEKLESDFRKQKRQKTEELLQEMKYSEVEELKKSFLEDLEKTEILRKVYKKSGFDYHAIQSKRYNFLGNQILPQEMNDFELFRVTTFQEVEVSNL